MFTETNIINVFKEGYFYGRKDSEISADEEITKIESNNRYGKLLEELRKRDDETEILDSKIITMIVEFVAHLCFRTKHLRDFYSDSANFLANLLFEDLKDFSYLKEFILQDTKNNPKRVEEWILSEAMKHISPELKKDISPEVEGDISKIIEITSSLFLQYVFPKIIEMGKPFLEILIQFLSMQVEETIPGATKKAHNKFLLEQPIPKWRAERYQLFHWFIYKSEIPLILGDVGCLFENLVTRKFKSIDYEDDKIKNIFLPISTNRILIGTRFSIASQVDFKVINEAIAKCSREFFICSVSSESSPEVAYLHSLIGKEAEIVIQEELERIYRDDKEQC